MGLNFIMAEFDIVGDSPLSWCKMLDEKKNSDENADDFERRIWKKRLHVDKNGNVFIPPMALKNCIQDTASLLSKPVPGKGKATFSKLFKTGVLVIDPLLLDVKISDESRIKANALSLNPMGKRGPGTRVMKILPLIEEWKTHARALIQSPEITQAVFLEHIETAGVLTGLGQFRPAVGGYCGRFTVKNLTWKKLEK